MAVATIVAGALGGLVGALLTKRLAFWELVIANILTMSAALLYGNFGFLYAPSLNLSFGETLREGIPPPGPMYLGPTWVRDTIVILLVALLQAITVSSVTFMLQSRGAGFERFIGARYLAAKRRDQRLSKTAIVAALGVSLGVAALIAVISAMSGYQAEVKDKILTTNAHIIVQKWGSTFDDYDDTQQKVDKVPSVVASSPFIFTGGMLSADKGMFPVLVKGIDVDQMGNVTRIREQLRHGDLPALRPGGNKLPGMFVGAALYKQLDVKIGDVVALVSPVGSEGKRGGPPKRMLFSIAGDFVSGMNEFDQRLVYIELESAQHFVGDDAGITGLEVRTRDPETVEDTTKKILAAIGSYPYRTIDWRQLNSGIFSALAMQKMLMVVILIFIIIVAAFNIASTLFMLVVEKARDVAVLKAMGARDGSVMKIFVIEGHLISAIGIVVGVLLGLFLCAVLARLRIHIAADVYLVDTLRVQVQPMEVLMVVLGSLEVAHLATLYPALRAARTLPAEAMRYG